MNWVALGSASFVCSGLLMLAQLPAALMLGPMIAAVVLAASGRRVNIHAAIFHFAQVVIGLLMAQSLTLPVLREILTRWPLFLTSVLAVIVVSFSLGWLLARLRIVPGSTALWGSSPGAAGAMTLLSGGFGADTRLVAFMLYLRVVIVALVTSMVARFTAGNSSQSQAFLPSAVSADLGWSAALLAITLSLVVRRIRFPAAPMLVSMAIGIAAHDTLRIGIAPPLWLLMPAYVVVGWIIGLRFTGDVLRHAVRALPGVLASTFTLIGVCALLGMLVARWANVDGLSAYLATSPGGADSIAIIAASNQVDVPFVMAMQVARFLILLLIGPALATWLARSLR